MPRALPPYPLPNNVDRRIARCTDTRILPRTRLRFNIVFMRGAGEVGPVKRKLILLTGGCFFEDMFVKSTLTRILFHFGSSPEQVSVQHCIHEGRQGGGTGKA